LVFADLARTAVLLSLPIAYWLGWLSLGHLFAVALLAGTAHVLFNTAYAAFFVRLVASENFLEANSKLSATRSISFMAGPALGGVLIQVLTAPIAMVVDALSFTVSAIQIARLKTNSGPVPATEDPMLVRAWGGMRYLWRHPYLRAGLACATTVNFFNFIGTSMLVLFASRNLALDPATIGLAFGVGASGGLLGAVLARPIAQRIGAGPLVALATIAFPLSVGIVAFADGPQWVRIGMLALSSFAGGFSVMCFDIPLVSLQTKVTHDHMRSRVSGAFMTVNYGIRPLGAVVGGLLGSSIGPRGAILVSAIGGALSVLWLLGSPILRVRNIEDHVPPDGIAD
jgi:predicted MFS family arabinose efflux permease